MYELDSSVIITRPRNKQEDFDSRQRRGVFSLPAAYRRLLQPNESPIQSTPGVKWTECEADHSPVSFTTRLQRAVLNKYKR